jgi:hypothetical protein
VVAALTRAGKRHRIAPPAQGLPPCRIASALGPTQSKEGIAGEISPPHRSEDLVGEDLGEPLREDLV